MKKEYVSPKLEAYKVQSTTILEDSVYNGGEGNGRPAQAKRVIGTLLEFSSFEDEEDQ